MYQTKLVRKAPYPEGMTHEEKYFRTLERRGVRVAVRWWHFHTNLTVYGEKGDQQSYKWPYHSSLTAVGIKEISTRGEDGQWSSWERDKKMLGEEC